MTDPTPSNYRDRKTGLVLFGLFEIVLGIFCAGMIPLMLLGQALARRQAGTFQAPPTMGPAIIMYGIMALTFIWLGIGSILARRWARAILLCLSGVALGCGLLSCVVASLILPRLWQGIAQNAQPGMPPTVLLAVKLVILAALLIIYILIPGTLFLFYRSPHVRRTCEARDPVERWTDRCPLPVLAYSLTMGLAGISCFGTLAGVHVFPLFGVVVSGVAGGLLCASIAVLLLYLARGFYLLRIRAWRVALAGLFLGGISTAVSFWRVDMASLYLKMGYDPRMAATSAQMFSSPALKWILSLFMVPLLIWLFAIRKFFLSSAASEKGA